MNCCKPLACIKTYILALIHSLLDISLIHLLMALSVPVCTPVLNRRACSLLWWFSYDSETLSTLTSLALFVQQFPTSYTVYHRYFLPLAKVLLFLILLYNFLTLRSQLSSNSLLFFCRSNSVHPRAQTFIHVHSCSVSGKVCVLSAPHIL